MAEIEKGYGLKFEKNILVVSINHDYTPTPEEVEKRRASFQSIFSSREEREIPLEDIKVSPEVGDVVPAETVFQVQINRPLYPGLRMLNRKDPLILPGLIDFLDAHHRECLNRNRQVLIEYTIDRLVEMITRI